MITLIHGDDIISSRNYFLELKRKTKQEASLSANNIDSDQLVNIFSGSSLFDEEKKLFIENLFQGRIRNQEKIIKIINANSSLFDIFIWEGKEIGKKNKSQFKNIEEKLYKVPLNIFKFLDSLRPNNPGNLTLKNSLLKNKDPEYIFFMLVRHFRILLSLQGVGKNIDEVKRLNPWQTDKYLRQIKLFGEKKLKEDYKKLLKLDLDLKTGKMEIPFSTAIDILLLEI